MKHVKVNTALFGAEVSASVELDQLYITVYANRIAHIFIKENEQVTMETVAVTQEYFATLGEEKRYHLIFEYGKIVDLEPEVRKKRAEEGGSKYALTDVFVVQNLGQRIIADVYMQFNRPTRPTKITSSVENAIHWTKKQMEVYESA